MEESRLRVDQDTWLGVFAPGAVLVAVAYLSMPAVRSFLAGATADAGEQGRAVLIAFLGAACATLAGLVNSFAAHWLYRAQFPWGQIWQALKKRPAPQGDTEQRRGLALWVMRRSPWGIGEQRLYGELLPHVIIAGDDIGGRFPTTLRSLVTHLAGPSGSEVGSARHYQYVAADLVRSWVLSRVGITIGTEGWRHASRFRQRSDALVTWSLAAPISVLMVLVAVVTATLSALSPAAGSTLVAVEILVGLTAAAVLYWACLVEVVVDWYQWQNEIGRLFYVASLAEEESSVHSAGAGG